MEISATPDLVPQAAKLAEMQSLSFLAELSPAGRNLFLGSLIRRSFPCARLVVEKGQSVSGAYFVVGGQLRVSTVMPNGKEATLYQLDPGDTCILALNSLFNDLLYPAWVHAEAETTIAIVPGNAFQRLFESEGAIRALTIKALSVVVFRLMAELEEVHSSSVEQRLASFLLARATGLGVVQITQQEIANRLGTTREVVARALSGFAAHGLVETSRGRIKIVEAPQLSKLVGAPGPED
jgi:CRP/FNR family transcriptional regulator